MNRINLLETRRAQLLESGKSIREKIAVLCDEGSFVEYDSYSFSKSEFYGAEAQGDGVITGFVTVDDNPFYLVAQNVDVLNGGVSLANCNKIVKCLKKAEKTGTPVIYLLNSLGVQAGEGVSVLEGIAGVLSAMTDLKGTATQIAISIGDVYGSMALIAAGCDYHVVVKDACVSYSSPVVISAADGKNLSKEEVGGLKAQPYNNMITLSVSDLSEAKAKVTLLMDYVYNPVTDCDDDLNRETESLNNKICPDCLIKAVFDDGKFVELNSGFADEVKVGLGRIGGSSVAGVIFGGGEKGVELNLNNIIKLKEFLYYAYDNELPVVTFVNTLGLEQNLKTNNTPIMKELTNLIFALKQTERISVVYGKAIGLGYTLFSAKNMGVDYSYATANSCIGLFEGKVGAMLTFADVNSSDLDKLAEKYSEETLDPINAAKDGYIDNIIEPRHLRQYVISAIESL